MALRKSSLFCGLALLGVSLALIACPVLLLRFTRQLNRDGFDQIQLGMSQAEVEALLGGPPGDYGRYRWGDVPLSAGSLRG
jgi:hypothetical protein